MRKENLIDMTEVLREVNNILEAKGLRTIGRSHARTVLARPEAANFREKALTGHILYKPEVVEALSKALIEQRRAANDSLPAWQVPTVAELLSNALSQLKEN